MSGRATGYTTAQAAEIVGLPRRRIRSLARAGVVRPGRRGREYRFSFQDLVILKAAAGLLESGISLSKVGRSLERLAAQLPSGRAITSVRIRSEAGEVVARTGGRIWEPATGQRLLDFEVEDLARSAAPLAPVLVEEARDRRGRLGSDEAFHLACELEATSLDEAKSLYLRVLEVDGEHPDAHLNLGRLLHEEGELDTAEVHYRRFLELSPDDPIGSFNLGVVLEDGGRLDEALAAYRRAVELDPEDPDAHFNLSGVAERLGQTREAIRHLKRYRDLVGAGS